MKIPNFSGLTKIAGIGKAFVMANRPELLFGASVVSTLGAVVLAGKGGYEAGQKVMYEEVERVTQNLSDGAMKEYEFFVQEIEPLSFQEKAQLTWKCYVPAAIATVGAVGSTTGLHLVHVKEKKALATAGLAALNEAREEMQAFKEKAIELIEDDSKTDEEKKDEILATPVENSDGEVEELYLVRDVKTGRDIWSNRRRIEEAVIELNNVLNGSGDCELNAFYAYAGFGNIPEGNSMGWSGALVNLEWGSTIRDDGRPVKTFEFRPAPTTGFDDAHA